MPLIYYHHHHHHLVDDYYYYHQAPFYYHYYYSIPGVVMAPLLLLHQTLPSPGHQVVVRVYQ